MKRLFLRFYLGVLFILFLAWLIPLLIGNSRDWENVQVVEKVYGGGARLAREQINRAGKERDTVLGQLRQQFEYALEIRRFDALPRGVRYRLAKGADIVFYAIEGEYFVVTRLANPDGVLQFGPLPTLVGPAITDSLKILGIVLFLAALAIALLLRPVVKQLRLVERTSMAIAEGDLSARVEERSAPSVSTLASAFNHMAGQTQSLIDSQRELLQAVSHELRTPLARITFAIDLLRDAQDEEQREHRLQSMERSTEELGDLVDELFRYVRLGANSSQIEERESRELRQAVESLLVGCSEMHPHLAFEVGDGLRDGDFVVEATPSSLERVLSNLLGNASRFARSRVRIDACREGDQVILDVDDDGEGIPEEERDRVFEPFVRFDEESSGAGLGLAIVQRILTNHSGSAEALDSPLGGCRIRVRWPLASDTNGASEPIVETHH